METCVYALRPARIFLNIGTNDMNPDDYRKDELMERYEKMVKEILAHLPGVQLTLLAYYPVNHEAACDDSWFFYRTNERICEANEAVKALSQKYSLGFLDLNAPLRMKRQAESRIYPSMVSICTQWLPGGMETAGWYFTVKVKIV